MTLMVVTVKVAIRGSDAPVELTAADLVFRAAAMSMHVGVFVSPGKGVVCLLCMEGKLNGGCV